MSLTSTLFPRPLTERTQHLINNNIVPSMRKTSDGQWILEDGHSGVVKILHFPSASETYLGHLARSPAAPYSKKDLRIDKGDSFLYFGAGLCATFIAANTAVETARIYMEPDRVDIPSPLPDKIGAKKSCLDEFYDEHPSSFEGQELSTYLEQCTPEKLAAMTQATYKSAVEQEAHSRVVAEGGLSVTLSLIAAWTFYKARKKWNQSENCYDASQAGRLIQKTAKQELDKRALCLD